MEDVILNDIPTAPNVYYLQAEDWVSVAILIIVVITGRLSYIKINQFVAQCRFFRIIKSNFIDWLTTHICIYRVFPKISRLVSCIGKFFIIKINQFVAHCRIFRIIKSNISDWLTTHICINRIFSKISRLVSCIGYSLIIIVLFFCSLSIAITIFDKVFGVDKTYRKIVSRHHYVSRKDIYEALNFVVPKIVLDTLRIENFVYCSDSIADPRLKNTIDSLYRVSDSKNTYTELYYLASMNGLPSDIQDFFYSQSLLNARNKYELLNPILQRYIVTDDLAGMLAIDSLSKSWKWELGILDNRFKPQDFLRTKCLYYAVQLLEQNHHITDSVANDLFKYACEGYKTSRRLTDSYSYVSLFFLDIRAKYAYRIHDPKADKYADQLIENSRRWENALSFKSYLFSPDRGGSVPGYYKRFFSDPLFLRYKSLLREKKYKKALLTLNAMSSITEDTPSDADNPYMYIHDSLQPRIELDVEDAIAYAKYDLASISENARLRRLMKKKNANDWLIGTYTTGVNYLSPTESAFAPLNEYAFNGDLYYSDLIPFMSINYNNDDSRWVYNTALFLKGTGADIPSLIEEGVMKSDNDRLKNLLSILKTEKVFAADTYPEDNRFEELDSLLRQFLGYKLKKVLHNCFYSYLDVRNALSDGECAIEIVKVPSLDFSDDYYKAVIVRNNIRHPIIINLAPASAINEAVSAGNLYGNGNHDLYSLVWKPIKSIVKPKETIYIAPDGVLCSVNIAALPDTKNHRLQEQYDVRQCVSTKEVVAHKEHIPHSSIALFGGAIYDDTANQNTSESKPFSLKAYRGVDCDSRGNEWKYLPSTKAEVESIDSSALNCGLQSNLFVGKNATEFQFKSLSGKDISILHIATHGFYYNKSIASELTFFERMAMKENPLNRCGLILTGGQKAWQGEDIPNAEEDGVLLGSEIARMDLTKVDMVVLSACNTGLGDISYEGVYGLQRAFKQAGVNNIIMTLNTIDDNATRVLMARFYRNLFSGEDTRTAFTNAINWIRDKTPYKEPEYWAPFLLIN